MGHEGLLFFRFGPSGLIEEEHRYLDGLTPMAQMGLLGGGVAARPIPTLSTELTVSTATGSPKETQNIGLVAASLAALDSKNETAFLSAVAEHAEWLARPRLGSE
jgi:hypothetical protein